MSEISMSWTGERIELLRKLWSDGLSASRIAAELGGVSRNAVIGKVHRLGMSGRGRAEQGPGAAPGPVDAALAAVRAGAAQALARSGIARLDPEPAIEPAPAPVPVPHAPARSAQAIVIPLSERVTIMELREQMCRWPMGDPARADFRFCGARSGLGGPYCATHARMAYQPALDRRRDRRAAVGA